MNKKYIAILLLVVILIVPPIVQATSTKSKIATAWNFDSTLISYIQDGKLWLMDANNGQVFPLPKEFARNVNDAKWQSQGTKLAVATETGDVMIQDIRYKNGSLTVSTAPITLNYGVFPDIDNHLRGPDNLSWSYTGKYLAVSNSSGGGDYSLRIWNIETQMLILSASAGPGVRLAWSPVSNLLAVASSFGIRLVNVDQFENGTENKLSYDSWQEIKSLAEGLESVGPAAWNATGTQIALADWYGKLWMVDVATGLATELLNIQPNDMTNLFNITDLQWNRQRLYGAIAISRYNETTRESRYESEVRVWDVSNAALLATYESEAGFLYDIDIDASGQRLVFGTDAGSTRNANLIDSGAVRIVDLTQ